MKQYRVGIIGGGLAGSEAAWQLSQAGIDVVLFEMRPIQTTPAHRTNLLAELVCSNSFKSQEIHNAHGVLKQELIQANSLILKAAYKSILPAGTALAVDREIFSSFIEKTLKDCKHLTIKREEVKSIESIQNQFDCIFIASGPLTSSLLANSLKTILGETSLFFYDSISPVIFTESIDMNIAFKEARYGKGNADYINCPMDQQEYEAFIEALIQAKKVPFQNFEQGKYFEGCLPIEVMAERGKQTLAYGPMKPVGLKDPRTGKQPYAVLQLRQENEYGTLFNMVGCQTKMTYSEQKKVFQMIPGLQKSEFARFGSMHRNTYINAPKHLKPSLELKHANNIYIIGQLTGVEGYTESTAMGIWGALQIIANIKHIKPLVPNNSTMIGALIQYLSNANPKHFQPMNANFGLMPPFKRNRKLSKQEKRKQISKQAIQIWKEELKQFMMVTAEEKEYSI